ncbi:DUF3526 domain-containing protein [Paraflavitalea sp. CAU 1676]|uniref:DUF3526 domain-containing protein n=1 Tax=Paraflavitalea sp. CAU 1676 TaxID=3032598 RepID=UPI0023DBB2B1|nr:DUF3526 domain-containing protein [Paraflavitalea sp. CAU 1676]MDF2192038.1 DUF3526 domain-containing protein [Paraflavitalea sp. CAU 1676]
MIQLAFRNFIRSRSVMAGLLLLLVAGIISLFIGRQFVERQQQHIADVTAWQQEHIDHNVKYFDKETGLLLYYLRFTLANPTHPLNGLSIGQRDVNPSVKSLTIRNLEAQQYDTEMYNPTNLLLGNLDLSFVLIYLFPLVIIGLTYNTLSGEKENGTWPLLSLQSGKPGKLILQLFALRGAVILGVFVVLMMAAVWILALPISSGLWAFVLVGGLYLFFWLAVSGWVVSWQRSSPVNAISLLAIWVILTMVAPAVINNFLINKYPTPEALNTAVEQRKGYHEKWDVEKSVTMARFYKHYPQFAHYGQPGEAFNWLWYYAMQQMGDDDAQQASAQLKEKLHQREKAGAWISWFVPTLHTQWQMNDLAHSGLGNHLQYQDSAARFHEQHRLFFYPKIFSNTPVKEIDWHSFRVARFSGPKDISWLRLLLPLVMSAILLSLLSLFNGRNQFVQSN